MFYRLRRGLRRQIAWYYRATDPATADSGPEFRGPCPACGGSEFLQKDILWDDLVDAWGLSNAEAAYLNRQGGLRCTSCGSRMRSMALAAWLCRRFGDAATLAALVRSPKDAPRVDVLEINEAGQLTQFLRQLPRHTLGCYPEVDMQAMPYADETFDLVVHSDTLEHVPDPVRALAECRRVLRPGGECAFTVPVVVGRLSRSTVRGLRSWHGDAYERDEGLRVRTEFGADAWIVALKAGFSEVTLFALEYPAAMVHIARR